MYIKKKAKKIGARIFECDPHILKATLKQIHTKESTYEFSIDEKLAKYNFPSKIITKLLRHLTMFKEHIDFSNVKEIGDCTGPNISIEYVYDGVAYNPSFDLDYSGNNKQWIWDDDFEFEDELDLHFIFRSTICKFLNNHYT